MKDAQHNADLPHFVYRVFDAEGRLLYIGCTIDVDARMAGHRAWGNQSEASFLVGLHGARVEAVEYPTFASARAAERSAIEAEGPFLNREHNPTRWRRVRGEDYLPVGDPYAPTAVEPNPRLLAVLARFA